MEASMRVHANCSEWDDYIEDDWSIEEYDEFINRLKKKKKEEPEWDGN